MTIQPTWVLAQSDDLAPSLPGQGSAPVTSGSGTAIEGSPSDGSTTSGTQVPGTPGVPPGQTGNSRQQSSGGGFGFSDMIFIFLILAVFWVVLILPQQREKKKKEQMLNALRKGARVATVGGIIGTVARVDDDQVVLLVAEGVKIRFNRGAIQTVIENSKEPEADEEMSSEPESEDYDDQTEFNETDDIKPMNAK